MFLIPILQWFQAQPPLEQILIATAIGFGGLAALIWIFLQCVKGAMVMYAYAEKAGFVGVSTIDCALGVSVPGNGGVLVRFRGIPQSRQENRRGSNGRCKYLTGTFNETTTN